MPTNALLVAVEKASFAIARLDARLSLSPLAEAWHVRASLAAGCAIATVEGAPVREDEAWAFCVGTGLGAADAYRAGLAGWAHWRRCLAGVPLSDLTARLVGRSASGSRAAKEAQEEWDMEDALTARARAALRSNGSAVDAMAGRSAARALDLVSGARRRDSAIVSLAEAVRAAAVVDPDPGYHERVDALRRELAVQARDRAGSEGGPSLEAAMEMVGSLSWEAPRALAPAFSAVPDALVEAGVTTSRLSCLTGASKRMAMEGRLDDRAVAGFASTLAREAERGGRILDGLEAALAAMAGVPSVSDPRSGLAQVVWAALALPSFDAPWLADALEMHPRVVRRFVRRLADEGALVAKGSARRASEDGSRSREAPLWGAAGFDDGLAGRRGPRRVVRGGAVGLGPEVIVERVSDPDVAEPMSAVFARFGDEMADLDGRFGWIWRDAKAARPSRGARAGRSG